MKKIYVIILNYLEKKIDASIEKYQKIKQEMHSRDENAEVVAWT